MYPKSLRTVCYLSALTFALACKPLPKASRVKGVEAVLSGDEAKREDITCGPGSAGSTLDRMIAAAPPGLKELYPNLKKAIKVSDDAQKICSDVFSKLADSAALGSAAKDRLTSRLASLNSCWFWDVKEKKAPGDGLPTIVLSSAANAVNNTFLPMLTYAVVEWNADVVGATLDALSGASGKRKDSKFNDLKEKLKGMAKTTPAEVAAFRTSAQKLRYLRARVARAVLANLKEEAKSAYRSNFAVPAGTDLAASVPLQNYLFAEMIDAHYCAKETHDKIKQRGLVRAAAAMTEVQKYLGRPWFE